MISIINIFYMLHPIEIKWECKIKEMMEEMLQFLNPRQRLDSSIWGEVRCFSNPLMKKFIVIYIISEM